MEMERKIRLFKNRIRRGAKWLDKHDEPDWRDKINKMTLDLSCGKLCMLGQRFGTFYNGMNIWRRSMVVIYNEVRWAVTHGFCIDDDYVDDYVDDDYNLLTNLWVEYLEDCKKKPVYQEKKQSVSSKPSLAMTLIPNKERQLVLA